MRTAIIMFLFALTLQGCGKKGPLYLPKPQPEQAASQNADSRNAEPQGTAQQPQSTPSK